MDEETVLAGRVTATAMAAMLAMIESGDLKTSEFDRGYLAGTLATLDALGLYAPQTAPAPDEGQSSNDLLRSATWHS